MHSQRGQMDAEVQRPLNEAGSTVIHVAGKTRKSSSGEPYISRRDDQLRVGANWRVVIQRDGTRFAKTFYDSSYGSASAALEAAKAWRDETFRTLPVVSKAQAVTRLRVNITSGVTGVRWVSKVDKKGRVQEWWSAFSPRLPGAVPRTRAFSVARYGERRAFALAVETRAAFVEQWNNVPHLPHYAAKELTHKLEDSPQDQLAAAYDAIQAKASVLKNQQAQVRNQRQQEAAAAKAGQRQRRTEERAIGMQRQALENGAPSGERYVHRHVHLKEATGY